MTGIGRYLTPSQIAEHAEVRLSAVSNWRARHPDFPQSQIRSGQECFLAADVLDWLAHRRIPKSARKATEPVGITYRERILQNVDSVSLAVPANSTAQADLAHTLRAAMAHLHNSHGSADAVELLLGMLYVRTRRSDLWRAVGEQGDWETAWSLLRTIRIGQGDTEGAPLFEPTSSAPPDAWLPFLFRTLDGIDPHTADDLVTGPSIETLLRDVLRDVGKLSGHYTPPAIANLMTTLLDPGASDSVLDPSCGAGELLAATARHTRRSGQPALYGQPSDERFWRTATLNTTFHNAVAHLSEPGLGPYQDQFAGQRFDFVLMNPPFSVAHGRTGHLRTDWPYGEPPAGNSNFAWLQHAVAKLRPNGRAAVLMPNSAAFSTTTREADIRGRMVEAGVIDCIVALPGQMFHMTSIPVMMWLLRAVDSPSATGAVLFIDASKLGTMIGRGERTLTTEDSNKIIKQYLNWTERSSDTVIDESGFARSVGVTEIRAAGYVLTPARYISTPPKVADLSTLLSRARSAETTLRELRERAASLGAEADSRLLAIGRDALDKRHGWHEVPLGDLVDVLMGPATLSREGRRNDWIPVVLPRNVRRRRIVRSELDMVPPETAGTMGRYRLAEGDIVGPRTGKLGRFGLVTAGEAGWLLGPGCFRLRPHPGTDADYLTYYLNHPATRHWVETHVRSSVIQHINSETVKRLPVALPPSETRSLVVAALIAVDSAAAAYRDIDDAAETLLDALLPLPVDSAD